MKWLLAVLFILAPSTSSAEESARGERTWDDPAWVKPATDSPPNSARPPGGIYVALGVDSSWLRLALPVAGEYESGTASTIFSDQAPFNLQAWGGRLAVGYAFRLPHGMGVVPQMVLHLARTQTQTREREIVDIDHVYSVSALFTSVGFGGELQMLQRTLGVLFAFGFAGSTTNWTALEPSQLVLTEKNRPGAWLQLAANLRFPTGFPLSGGGTAGVDGYFFFNQEPALRSTLGLFLEWDESRRR